MTIVPTDAQMSAIVDLASTDRRITRLHGYAGTGKGHPYGTPILTTSGWVPVEELTIGDEVIGRDGGAVIVYGLWDRGVLPVYRVTMSDGSSVEVDGDHLWQITNSKGRTYVDSTRAILDLWDSTFSRTNPAIPSVEPVRFDDRALPIPPYMLGALLADGALSGSSIQWTKNADSVVEQMRVSAASGGYSIREVTRATSTARQWAFSHPDDREHWSVLNRTLAALDLRTESAGKHVPEAYLFAGVEQRRALMHGLFDGDGRYTAKGQPTYHSTSIRLAQNVLELVRSLGMTASLRKLDDGTWRVGILSDHDPFLASQKRAPRNRRSTAVRRIISIEPVGEAEVRCIAVTAPDSLYVAKDYIVTHNTSVVATQAIQALERAGVSVQVLAPTGKAAKVLRSKGLHGASTIHSYLYAPSKLERRAWREMWDDFAADAAARDERLIPALQTIDAATAESNVEPTWQALIAQAGAKTAKAAQRIHDEKRYELAFTASGAIAYYEEYGTPAADVLLIDEASMVSAAVSADLERTGSRLIFVGDPAQLPPVKAQRSTAAMGEPHHLLTQVHRQKGGSPVLKLATQIRKSTDAPRLEVTPRRRLLRVEDYAQVLCWRNATREQVNAQIRRALGRAQAIVPEPGDRLVCLKNTKMREDGGKQWMNGEQATVLDVGREVDESVVLLVRDDEDSEHEVFSPLETFRGHRAEQAYLDRSGWSTHDPAFAFGYALTVHKSQGSEWPTVLLVDESADMIAMTARREGRPAALEQARAWLYTAVTRAAEQVHIVSSVRDVL